MPLQTRRLSRPRPEAARPHLLRAARADTCALAASLETREGTPRRKTLLSPLISKKRNDFFRLLALNYV